jgi:hypothetical protein
MRAREKGGDAMEETRVASLPFLTTPCAARETLGGQQNEARVNACDHGALCRARDNLRSRCS